MSSLTFFFLVYSSNILSYLYQLDVYRLEQYFFIIIAALFIFLYFVFFLWNYKKLEDAFTILRYSIKDSCLFLKACLTYKDKPLKSNYSTNYVWNKKNYHKIKFSHITLIYVLAIFLLFTLSLAFNEYLDLEIYLLYIIKWLYLSIFLLLVNLLFLLNSNRISRSNDITPLIWTYFVIYSFFASEERALFWQSYSSSFFFLNMPLLVCGIVIKSFIVHLNLFISLTITDSTFFDIYFLESSILWFNPLDIYLKITNFYKIDFSITICFNYLYVFTNNIGDFSSYMSSKLGNYGSLLVENVNFSDVLESSGGSGGSSGGNPGGNTGGAGNNGNIIDINALINLYRNCENCPSFRDLTDVLFRGQERNLDKFISLRVSNLLADNIYPNNREVAILRTSITTSLIDNFNKNEFMSSYMDPDYISLLKQKCLEYSTLDKLSLHTISLANIPAQIRPDRLLTSFINLRESDSTISVRFNLNGSCVNLSSTYSLERLAVNREISELSVLFYGTVSAQEFLSYIQDNMNHYSNSASFPQNRGMINQYIVAYRLPFSTDSRFSFNNIPYTNGVPNVINYEPVNPIRRSQILQMVYQLRYRQFTLREQSQDTRSISSSDSESDSEFN